MLDFYIWLKIWIGLAVMIIPIAIFIKAPYGRHVRNGWGVLIDNKTGWFLMELPTLIICPLIFMIGNSEKSIVTLVFIMIFLIHYINRVLIFPFRIRTIQKKIPFLKCFIRITILGICNVLQNILFNSLLYVGCIRTDKFLPC